MMISVVVFWIEYSESLNTGLYHVWCLTQQIQPSQRIKIIPAQTSDAEIIRCRPNASLNINVPIKAAKITLVSRKDDTIAIEPSPMAKITSP